MAKITQTYTISLTVANPNDRQVTAYSTITLYDSTKTKQRGTFTLLDDIKANSSGTLTGTKTITFTSDSADTNFNYAHISTVFHDQSEELEDSEKVENEIIIHGSAA